MAPPHSPPQRTPKTEDLELDDDSDRDSGVGAEEDDACSGCTASQQRLSNQDGNTVENKFTVFVAFQGNMEDEDFTDKLNSILSGIPNMLDMDLDRLQPQHVEPWNSVRVTFNIPREAAERLRLLAQNNQQQLRELGILSVQIEGEGAINVVPGPNRGQEVRVNGPIGAPGQIRMDIGFPGQSGPGVVRMVPPGPGMPGQPMLPGSSGQMHPRVPRPPSQTDMLDPMMPGMSVQQQQLQHQQAGPHGAGPMPPQAAHHMQALQAGRPLNPAALQQLQQQHHQQQQAQQLSQLGPRAPFNPSGQMAVPPGWNQMPQAAQGGPSWRKPPPQGQMIQRPPSLATVQTPSHPPPPYPFGSQQAGQVFNAMGQGQLAQQQQAGMGQFATPQPKGPQGVPGGVIGPPRPPPPMQSASGTQGNLTAKSPGSSSSPFQQGSPGTPPMMAQRPTTPQGFPQGVGSPGRAALGQQGNMQQGFMGMPQHGQPGAQVHPGMAKRPMGFPNPNFVQGQVSANTPGTPVGGANQQLQSSQALTHTGTQPSASTSNSVQGLPHASPNVIGIQNSMAGLPPGTTAGSSMGQQQPGLQTQMMGLQHQAQPVSSSPSQMVQAQGAGQTVLSRPLNQGQRGGMTPPKQMMPQQGQGVMHGQGQMVGGQGHQAMLLQQQQQQQQNPMMEQMVANQMQGNKQAFGGKIPPGVMPAQMMRGPSPNVQGNMFQGQVQQMTPQQQQQMAQLQQQQLQQHQLQQQQQQQQQQHAQMNQQGQQLPIAGNPNQVMGMHGQQMRLSGGHPLIQQQLQQQQLQQQKQQAMLQQQQQAAQQHPHPLGDPSGTAGDMGVQQMVPDMQAQQQQQGMMGGPQHMQMGNGHFTGHGMNFNSQFPGQMPMGGPCGQAGNFPVSKDVTLTSPLLVNLLQSDISASQFGPGGKQGAGGANQAKPKKKKPPRKKKPKDGDGQAQGDGLGGLDASMEESEHGGEQSMSLDNSGTKLPDFPNRPPGFHVQSGDQRVLQQVPMQFMQQHQQHQQQQLQHMQLQQQQLHLQQHQQQIQQMQGLQNAPGQPGMSGPQPGMTGPQQVMTGQQPGMSGPQAGISGLQPGMTGPQPGMTGPQPGMAGPQPGMAGQQPGMAGPQPGMTGQQPGMPGQQPGMTGPQPGMSGPQPGMTSQQQGMTGLHPGTSGQQSAAQGQPQMHPHQLQQQQQAQQQSHLQQQQQQQQMMMMMKMQQEQAKNRMSIPPGSHLNARGISNSPEVQRLPVSQQGNMSVMISLQGPGSVPPSPDKARGMPLMVNPQLAGAPRRMSHPDVGQGPQATGSDETTAVTQPKQDRAPGHEMGVQSANGAQQMMANQGANSHIIKQGPSSMPQHPGASPQQQLPNQPQQASPMPGLHFPNVPTTSQSSRPKTPNRASPRPYHHPLTPTNRPPSTEPSEINLSPERLNASIAGLFPPKINIPLPPRQPNLNRGFDQQGLNPTTLKAIGQAPPSLALAGNNNNGAVSGNTTNSGQQSFSGTVPGAGAKQDKQSGAQGKRASPSNSRRSSPASSRKSATPSPGRQKGAKMAATCSPHQQQLANPQGQTMMLSPASATPNPGTMPSQAVGVLDAQQPQSHFNAIQSNSAEAGKDGQGEPRPMSQSQAMRELTTNRMTNPRIPNPHQPNIESQTGSSDRQQQDVEISPALRQAPTSLNQLLDNMNVPVRTLQSSRDVGKMAALDGEKSHSNAQSSGQSTVPTTSDSKPAVSVLTSTHILQQAAIPSSLPSTNINPLPTASLSSNSMSTLGVSPNVNMNSQATTLSNLNTNTNTTVNVSPNLITSVQSNPTPSGYVPTKASSALKPSPNPKPVTSVHSVIQIPASSSNISQNQITVFVTSNPITSAPTSQPPTSMVSTMVAVPNKNVRPQDVRQPGPATRPQFITTTPLFINPIIQVPGASVTANTTVVSQPVTMVQVSNANIQLSSSVTSSQPRNAMGQIQITTTVPSSALIVSSQQTSSTAPKTDSPGETVQKSSPPLQQSSPHALPPVSSPFQPPLSSPPPCSSPGAITAVRKNAMSSSPTAQVKLQHGPVVTTQAVNLPTSSPNQMETTTSPSISSPRTSPGQIVGHSQLVTQAPITRHSQIAATQAAVASVTTAVTNSPVTPVQSLVPSNVPDGSSNISSPPSNQTGPHPNPTELPKAEPSSHSSSLVESSQTTTAPSQDVAQAQETLAVERTNEEVPSGPDQGWAKKRKTPINLGSRTAVEKPKGPSRRSSRADREIEEEPVLDSSSRKRSARPATSTAIKETGASPTQAKRRKSK